MSIEIKQVNVLDNPSGFTSPFKFEITFDCLSPGIKNELEWKLIYVGSADDDGCDQELDSVLVGPVQVGKNRFIFQAPCPDASKIPEKDLLDVTVLLLTCSYGGNEFMRVGYYVMNEYPGYNNDSGMALPSPIDISKIRRNILANKPRVTRFHIDWDDNTNNNNGSNDNNGKNDNINNNNNNNKNKNKNDSNNGNVNDSDEKWQNNKNGNGNGNGNNNNENRNDLNSILDENDYRLARALDEQYSNANNNNNNDNGDGDDEEEEEEEDDGDANNNANNNDNNNDNDNGNQENDEQDDDDMEMIS